MASSYTYKNRADLAYDANKKRLRAEGQIILATILNEALNEMTVQFNKAKDRGEVLTIGGTQKEMKAFLKLAADRELSDGK